ncbi:hypothetical protein B0F90DRAFT_1711140 [Multifurca ochricompacta]|uniref:Uncharacterized protein n=1 Tax=Multifurca ochricompacta TaxID=376703 RepID=A0AAD4QPL0_9AGAM|nr:hypothetical protein B0F90DRAFT_1711140 [Multifurca ochricompacta]
MVANGLMQQDMLTVRENTRRNATTGYKPESQYRPMLALNPEGRKVTFLTRTPTSPQAKHNDNSLGVVTAEESSKREEAPAPAPGMVETRQLPPSPLSQGVPSRARTSTLFTSLNVAVPHAIRQLHHTRAFDDTQEHTTVGSCGAAHYDNCAVRAASSIVDQVTTAQLGTAFLPR